MKAYPMFEKKEAFCALPNTVVRVWCQKAAPGVEPRVIRCENSQQCPRTAFCRFVNPLTTRSPLTFNIPAAARPASKSTRLPPVADHPASG